jgi:hypothetical protein
MLLLSATTYSHVLSAKVALLVSRVELISNTDTSFLQPFFFLAIRFLGSFPILLSYSPNIESINPIPCVCVKLNPTLRDSSSTLPT